MQPGDWKSGVEDWFVERFYEILLVVPKASKTQLERSLTGEFWCLGEVIEGMADLGDGKPVLADRPWIELSLMLEDTF